MDRVIQLINSSERLHFLKAILIFRTRICLQEKYWIIIQISNPIQTPQRHRNLSSFGHCAF